MPSTVRFLLDRFWTPQIWLPRNLTWTDVVPNGKVRYTDYTDLYYPLPMALGLLLLRRLLELYVFSPFGQSLGIKWTKPKKAPTNDLLEKAFRLNKKTKYEEVMDIAEQCDMSERQVERWLRLRRAQEKPSTLTKFCEDSWRCSCYSFSVMYGIWCLWDKPWLWNIDECWINYPHQGIDNNTWWYFMISLSLIWSLAFSQFSDVKRTDFWQMFVHHIVTIALTSYSFFSNLHRIGSLVILVHDCSDIFLEAAKMAKYAKYNKVSNGLFVFFAVLWLITRIGVFPMWIVYSTSIRGPRIADLTFPAFYVFNGLLLLLLCMHILWTHLILQIAYVILMSGKVDRDVRSSSSEEMSDVSTNSTNHANMPKTS